MKDIIFIMGKSSSGKDTVYRRLLADRELGLSGVVPYTTRPARSGEKEGVEYHFVTDGKAQELLEAGRVIEMRTYSTVHGPWKYFTVDDGQICLGSGKRYVVIGTLEAYMNFVKYFGGQHILPIYIEVDDGLRLQRALDRERQQEAPRYAELCRRFLADCEDFSEEKLESAQIRTRFHNNGRIDACMNEIVALINETKKIPVESEKNM